MRQRPFIHVNCAMSPDGKIAGTERKQIRISSDEDILRVKNLRKEYDAILVGIGTVLADDPKLTVKGLDYAENPVRIILDTKGRTPENAKVLDGNARTVIVTGPNCNKVWDNAEVMRSKSLTETVSRLFSMGIESILVEGGGEVISSFFKEKIVDKYSVYVGNIIIGGRNAPTPVDGDSWVTENGITLKLECFEILGEGAVLSYTPVY